METIKLGNALQELTPTGNEGFEGLIGKLLSELTDFIFHLCHSGTQDGIDMATVSSRNVIAAQCKRYSSDLPSKNILGGDMIAAYKSSPFLELWILVASCEVPQQKKQYLTSFGPTLPVLFIDGPLNNYNSLYALCCEFPLITEVYLNKKIELKDLEELKNSNIENHNKLITYLREQIVNDMVLREPLKEKQNKIFKEILSKPTDKFGQFLDMPGAINRSIECDFRKWLCNWETHKKPLLILGEEGVGKTWAVVHWLFQLEHNLPVFFIPFFSIDADDFSHIILNQLKKITEELTQDINFNERNSDEFWGRKLNRWRRISKPLFLIVIDGVYQKSNKIYKILSDFKEKWSQFVQLVLTTRPGILEPVYCKDFHPITITHYNDVEFKEILSKYNLTPLDIPENIMDLTKIPRYLNTCIQLIETEEVIDINHITKPQLLYYDFKNKYEKDPFLASRFGLDFGFPFSCIIYELVDKYYQDANKKWETLTFKPSDISEHSTIIKDIGFVLQELKSARCIDIKKLTGEVTFEEKLFKYGMGLYLLEKAKREYKKYSSDRENRLDKIRHIIQENLEPQPDMDLKVEILEYAVFFSSIEETPEEVKLALLLVWVRLHNFWPRGCESFPAYFYKMPEVYFLLAENVWSSEGAEQRALQMLMLRTFSCALSRQTDLRELFIIYLNRWLSFCLTSVRHLENSTSVKIIDIMSDLDKYNLVPAENGNLIKMRLFALAILSSYPLTECIEGLIKFVITGDLIQISSSKQMKWLLQGIYGDFIIEPLVKYIDRDNPDSKVNSAILELLNTYGSIKCDKYINDLSQITRRRPAVITEAYDKINTNNEIVSNNAGQACNEIVFKNGEQAFNVAIYPFGSAFINPALPKLSDETINMVAEFAKNKLDPCKISGEGLLRRGVFQSKEDLFYKQISNFLFSNSPGTAANIIRLQVSSLTSRDKQSLTLIYDLDLMIPILRDNEIKAIRNLRKSLYPPITQTIAMYLNHLCPAEILHSTPSEIVSIIQEIPDETPLYHHFEIGLSCIASEELIHELIGAITKTRISREKSKYLYILRNIVEKDLKPVTDILLNHVKNEEIDDKISEYSLSILTRLNNKEAAELLWNKGWCWEKLKTNDSLNYLKLELLHQSRYLFKDIPYPELRNRLRWDFLGIWLTERDNPEEFAEYGKDLIKEVDSTTSGRVRSKSGYLTWIIPSSLDGKKFGAIGLDENPSGTKVTYLDDSGHWQNSDNELSETIFPFHNTDPNKDLTIWKNEWQAFLNDKNYLYHDFVQPEALEGMAKHNLSCLQELADRILTKVSGNYKEFEGCPSFYYVLMLTLLKYDSVRGVKLLLRMDNLVKYELIQNGIPLHFIEIFKEGVNEEIINLREILLNSAMDDSRLYELVIASHFGDHKWLIGWAIDKTCSTKAKERALGVRILGWCEGVEKRITEMRKQDDSYWVRETAYEAHEEYKRNSWAKTWYRRIYENRDIDYSWAAAQLFLKSADHRVYIWSDKIKKEYEENISVKHKYLLAVVWEKFENTCKNIRKKLKDSFLKHDLTYLRDQMWPWLDKYI